MLPFSFRVGEHAFTIVHNMAQGTVDLVSTLPGSRPIHLLLPPPVQARGQVYGRVEETGTDLDFHLISAGEREAILSVVITRHQEERTSFPDTPRLVHGLRESETRRLVVTVDPAGGVRCDVTEA